MTRIGKQGLSTSTSSEQNDGIDNKIRKLSNRSIFDTVVVTDFIANPDEFLDSNVLIPTTLPGSSNSSSTLKNQFEGITSAGGTSNVTYRQFLSAGPGRLLDASLIDLMPKNSILGINISNGKNHQNNDTEEVFFPFFSHMSLPVKSGEQVWVFYDNTAGRKIGYWLSRKVGTMFVNDLNYTHIDRQAIIGASLAKNITSKGTIRSEKVDLFGMTFPNPSLSGNANKTLNTKNYETILAKSFSHDTERLEFVGEAVPRYTKKCADLTLQGSNNTLILMTHEGAVNTGTIKIATGRKTIPSKLNNIREIDKFEHEEIDKLSLLRGESPDLSEGSFDGTESTMLNMTEKFGGMIEIINSSGSSIKIMPSDPEDEEGTLEVDGGIVLKAAEGKFIRLGGADSEESAVLGDTLASILTDLINNLLTISLATGVGPTGPLSASVDGGGAQISGLLSRIESIKSVTTKVK